MKISALPLASILTGSETFPINQSGVTKQTSSLFSVGFSLTPYITKALYDSTTTGGFFSTFDCKGSIKFVLSQSENQSAISGGGFRDAMFIQHQDNDVVDYTLVGQKVSYAVRAYITGKANGSTYASQFKDFIAGDFVAIGSQAWSSRGVSGVAGTAIGYNVGIIDNEFAASQPAAATAQSLSMAAGQFIISSKFAASDGSHFARGVLVTNLGKSVTSAFEAGSAGTDGDNGQYQYLLNGTSATVNNAAIFMPASSTANVGTTIVYDANDLTDYDRGANTFRWVIGGSVAASFTSSAFQIGDANLQLNLNGGTPFLGFDSGDILVYSRAANQYLFQIGSATQVGIGANLFFPNTTDVVDLGATTLRFGNLFLGSAKKIDFNNGNVTITHSAGTLTTNATLSHTGSETILSGTGTPAGGTTGSGFKMGSAAVGVFFGSGAPTLSAAQGSIYLRTDGGINTRIYSNTNGTTGWTPMTNAA